MTITKLPNDGKQWVIYDPVDDCWLGVNEDETGPRTFPDKRLAMCTARITGVQMRYDPTRLRVEEWRGGTVRKKDEVPTHMTPLEALKRLERGSAL